MSLEPSTTEAAGPGQPTLLERIKRHFPPGQFLRYLCVGVFNTVFGYSCFAVLNHLFHKAQVPASYVFAAVLANVISITVAYLGYKFFVFRTPGNYLREWLKAMGVYGIAALPGLVLLVPLVHLIAWLLPAQISAMHHTVAGKDAALMHGEIREVTLWLAGACVALAAVYYFAVHRLTREEA